MAFSEDYGYIVVVHNNSDGTTETFLYECDPGESHRHRLESLPFNVLRCLGGGRFAIDDNEKVVELFGQSDTYGREPDRELSAELIKERYEYNGFTVRIRQT